MPIQSFNCSDTQKLYEGSRVPKFVAFQAVAERKLQLLDSAVTLESLRAPPGNRLEQLNRDRTGQHSIRINDQFRICFVWSPLGPEQVEIVDYH